MIFFKLVFNATVKNIDVISWGSVYWWNKLIKTAVLS
jgi:hypothetical protein